MLNANLSVERTATLAKIMLLSLEKRGYITEAQRRTFCGCYSADERIKAETVVRDHRDDLRIWVDLASTSALQMHLECIVRREYIQ